MSAVLLFCAALCTSLTAQNNPSAFDFQYVGPNPIPVGADCQNSLVRAGFPQYIMVVPKSGIGSTILESRFDSIASGFLSTDLLPITAIKTVHWFVRDSKGNTATFQVPISFADTTAPTIVKPPRDTVVYCGPGNSQVQALSKWIHDLAGAEVTDNCAPGRTLIFEYDSRTGTGRDSAGVVADFIQSFSQPCDTKFFRDPAAVTQASGFVFFNLFAVDESNNRKFLGNTFFIARDTTRPAIPGPVTTLTPCGPTNTAAIATWINAKSAPGGVEDCSSVTFNTFSWTTSENVTGTGTPGTGPYPQAPPNDCDWWVDVIFNLVDKCGNMATPTRRFEINDLIPPVFTGVPATATLFCPAPPPTQLSAGSATDNCDATPTITFSYKYSDTTCVGNYTLRVTWTATDDCGNSSSFVQTIAVRDTVSPAFTRVPADITAACDTYTTLPLPVIGTDVQATDGCGQIGSIVLTGTTNDRNPDPALCGHYNFTVLRQYTATDACGNTKTAVQRVNVRDVSPPTFRGFLDTTVQCQSTLAMTPRPVATDACAGNVLAFMQGQTQQAGTCPGNYNLTLTWTATDACGNSASFSQIVQVRDTIRPTLAGIPTDAFAECINIPAPPALSSLTGSDNCDAMVAVNFLESEIRDPDPTKCARYTNYLLRRTWTATDDCGNSRTYIQNVTVQDNTPPVITVTPMMMRPATPTLCGAAVLVPAPLSVYDACTAATAPVSLADTKTITGQSASVAVDTLKFSWAAPNQPPLRPVVGAANLEIFLENADAENADEHFRIYGEDGALLGKTTPTSAQCGSGTTNVSVTAAQLNAWLTDGQLTITLAPNGSGPAAINAISCPGGAGRARATLTYASATPALGPSVTYSVDGAAPAAFPPANSTFLSVGNHTVVYTATDCAGNSSTASAILRIEDLEAPRLTAPAAQTAFVGTADCVKNIALPFPAVAENCSPAGSVNLTSALVNLQFEIDPDADTVPKATQLSIGGLIPNAISGGFLKIRHKGDNAQPGEFFAIFDENNVRLAATTAGTPAGECKDFHETTIPVTSAQINNWAANGVAVFRAVANTDLGNFSNFISPCGPLNNGFDNTSQLQAVLQYDYAVVNYQIKRDTQTVLSGALNGSQTTIDLPPGLFSVIYRSQDASGNIGTAIFRITVRDTVRPTARCVPKILFAHPSGLEPIVVKPSDINNNSTDNCRDSLRFQVSQINLTCNQVGQMLPITLTVRDTSGNTGSCSTTVSIQSMGYEAGFSPNVCEGGTVQLFANPPQSQQGTVNYTYKWEGPRGFTSNLPNPILSTVQTGDSYVVTVTGPTGCTAVGTIQTSVIGRPGEPVLMVSPTSYCIGDSARLTTQNYTGNNIKYSWYRGVPGSGTLLGETTFPSFTLRPTNTPGTTSYYVQVSNANCSSLPSAVRSVTVNPIPVAMVAEGRISACEGARLQLISTSQGPGMTYRWTGPNGFMSQMQQPTAIQSVSKVDSGTYTLKITQFGCESNPAFVDVTVRSKPAAPIIIGDSQVCERETVELTSSVRTASSFTWRSPKMKDTTTTINSLTLRSVMSADSGVWRVAVELRGCRSDFSAPFQLQVQPFPVITAARSNLLVCQDSVLRLSATGNTTGLNFEWRGPNNFSAFAASTTAPTVAGNYTVIGSIPGFGCADTAVVTVQTVQKPVIQRIDNDAPKCTDGSRSIKLSPNTATQHGPLRYSWTGGLGGTFTSTQREAVIPNASTAKNGTYTLVVRDTVGCVSEPLSVRIEVADAPTRPILTPQPAVCDSSEVLISIANADRYTNGVFRFNWQTPRGKVVSNLPNINIPKTSQADSGDYSVVVTKDSCTSLSSETIKLTVNAIPAPPVLTANRTTLCAGDILNLSSPEVLGATYTWEGPIEGRPTTYTYTIDQVAAKNIGAYRQSITINGCKSPLSAPVNIQVLPRPAAPVILLPDAVCLEQTDTLELSIEPGSATPGARYRWFNSILQRPISADTPALRYQLANFNGIIPGRNFFNATATLNGCVSPFADEVVVFFDTIPDDRASFPKDQINACASQPLDLFINAPGTGTGRWSQVSGATTLIINPNTNRTSVQNIQADSIYRFSWRLSNGACRNYSGDTITVKGVESERAIAGGRIDTCFAKSIKLRATEGQTSKGRWSQPPGQVSLGIVFEKDTVPNTLVSRRSGEELPKGDLQFIWSLEDIGCGVASDTFFVRHYTSSASAGADVPLCAVDPLTKLKADALESFETGRWASASSSINITNPTAAETTVSGLVTGPNTFFWTTNNGVCGRRSRDTLVVNYAVQPTAEPDEVVVTFGNRVIFDVRLNDRLPDANAYTLTLKLDPKFGSATSKEPGIFEYSPNLKFNGQKEDQMVYELCSQNPICPTSSCSLGTVNFTIEQAEGCAIPTVITPNDDDYNDIFIVPCLIGDGNTGQNEVTIFNQWGDEVYHAVGYQNDWKGTYNGQPLPAGTYFYVIDYKNDSDVKKGFLVIQY